MNWLILLTITFGCVRHPHTDQLNSSVATRPVAPLGEILECVVNTVQQAQAGDEAAQTALIKAYSRRVRGLVRSMLRNSNAVDDVVQMAFIKAIRCLPGLRNPRAFESWLFRLTRTICLDHLRKQNCRPRVVAAEHEFLNAPDERSDELVAEIHDALDRALQNLSECNQTLIRMIVEGHDYRSIAAASGLSMCALKVRVNRIRAFLRVAVGTETGTRAPKQKELAMLPCLQVQARYGGG